LYCSQRSSSSAALAPTPPSFGEDSPADTPLVAGAIFFAACFTPRYTQTDTDRHRQTHTRAHAHTCTCTHAHSHMQVVISRAFFYFLLHNHIINIKTKIFFR
jgi:hypothetical protein